MRALSGYHAIEEYLKAMRETNDAKPPARSRLVLAYAKTSNRIDALIQLAESAGVSVVRRDAGELDALVGKRAHRGVLLEVPRTTEKPNDLRDFIDAAHSPNCAVLVLDGVTDPHNLGAILRSADQFGVDLVVLPSHRTARLSDTVFRTSAGTAARVPLINVTNVTRALMSFKEAQFWVYGADTSGKNVVDTEIAGRTVLVVGSEGKGLSRLVRETCDELIRIPSYGTIDSLNVSVAAGVLLYELRRSQGYLSG